MGHPWGEADANLCLGVAWQVPICVFIEFVLVLAMSLSLCLYLGVSWGQ